MEEHKQSLEDFWNEKAQELFEWAKEQNLLHDSKLMYQEARRRWVHLTSRYGLGKILEKALERRDEL